MKSEKLVHRVFQGAPVQRDIPVTSVQREHLVFRALVVRQDVLVLQVNQEIRVRQEKMGFPGKKEHQALRVAVDHKVFLVLKAWRV